MLSRNRLLHKGIMASSRRTEAPVIWAAESSQALTFLNRTDLANSGTEFFAASPGGTYGHLGLDDLFLAAGENGGISAKILDANTVNFVLGFDETNTQQGYTSIMIAMNYGGAPEIYQQQGASGYEMNETLPSDGTGSIRILRWGKLFKMQKSLDSEATWTDLVDPRCVPILQTSSNALYIPVDIYQLGNGKMAEPKIWRYGSGKVGSLLMCLGNSLVRGYTDGSNTVDYPVPELVFRHLNDGNNKWIYRNGGIGGQETDAITSSFATDAVAYYHPDFIKQIHLIQEGTNSLKVMTAAAAAIDMGILVQTALDADPRNIVVLCMCPNANPTNGGFTDAKRRDYNDAIALFAGPRVKLLDIRGNATFDNPTSYTNHVYYDPVNEVHKTQAGYSAWATLVNEVMDTITV